MKILSFGSLNLDHVYTVPHFVRPGETVAAEKFEVFCGGKGLNQSVALGRAGADVYHAGLVGRDGKTLTDLLMASGCNVENVAVCGSPTGRAMIQVDQTGENCIIINGGANREIGAAFIEKGLRGFSRGDICLFQNEISNVPLIMRAAHEKGMLVAFNPSPITEDVPRYPLACVTWFILNRGEGGNLTGETEPEKISSALLRCYPGCRVVLTLGGEGVYYRDAAQSIRRGAYHVKAVDTTGAGDTFTGYFLAGAAQGLALDEILRRASVAAALAVTRKGASGSIPTLDEVLHAQLAEV